MVTGATTGIGRACAWAFAHEGSNLVIVGTPNDDCFLRANHQLTHQLTHPLTTSLTTSLTRTLVVGRREELLSDLEAKLTAAYPAIKVLSLAMSVTDLQEVERLPEALRAKGFGDLHVLVNNAGLGTPTLTQLISIYIYIYMCVCVYLISLSIYICVYVCIG